MKATKVIQFLCMIVSVMVLSACGSMGAGFHKANDVNSARATKHYDAMTAQSIQNLMAVDQCYLAAGGGRMLPDGTVELTGSKGDAAHCAVMSMGLQTTSTLMIAFAPFIVTEMFSRVPDSPEEIMKDIVKMGFNFAVTKYGIDSVRSVVTSGQLASYRLAQAAMAKNPIVVNPSVINTSPDGASILAPGGATTVNP